MDRSVLCKPYPIVQVGAMRALTRANGGLWSRQPTVAVAAAVHIQPAEVIDVEPRQATDCWDTDLHFFSRSGSRSWNDSLS